MIRIEANTPYVEPPQWAILERSLIDLMDAAVEPVPRLPRGQLAELFILPNFTSRAAREIFILTLPRAQRANFFYTI